MKPKFTYGQFIVKKMRPIKNVTMIPSFGMMMYSEENHFKYGVFRVDILLKGDWEAPIDYKVRLVPVGKSEGIFMDHEFYTQDLRDTLDEMIVDDMKLAEKFIDEFLND